MRIGTGAAQGPPRLALAVDLPPAVVAELEMGIGPDLARRRQHPVHIRRGGLGGEMIGGEEGPAWAGRAGAVGDLPCGFSREPVLGDGFASGLSSFHPGPPTAVPAGPIRAPSEGSTPDKPPGFPRAGAPHPGSGPRGPGRLSWCGCAPR